MNRNIIVILGIVILAGAWFFLSPLFIDRTVDERFDFVSDAGEVDMTVVMAMSPDKQPAMMPDIMDAAAPDSAASESMPANAPHAIAKGNFVDADAIHKGSGPTTVYALADGRHVTDGGYLSLGKLKGNVGNQNYVVPPGTDIAEYHSVIIWCELFGVLFSPAALTQI